MTYTPQTWANGQGGGTPLSAARLQHIEDGLAAVDSSNATVASASAGATLTLDLGPKDLVQTITLTVDCTLTITPPATGIARRLTLLVVQDGTGGRILTFTSSGTQSVLWDSGSPPQLSAGPGKVDKLTLTTVAAGTPWYGQVDAIDLR